MKDLKTAQIMVIKFMYNGRLYMQGFFFFFLFFLSIEQYVLFDIFQLNLSRTCVVSLWFTYPQSLLFIYNDKHLTPQHACETTSSLNLKLVCCKFQLRVYKCMYGLKCYQLYHVCRLFPINNVYSSIFFNYIMISCKDMCMASVGL